MADAKYGDAKQSKKGLPTPRAWRTYQTALSTSDWYCDLLHLRVPLYDNLVQWHGWYDRYYLPTWQGQALWHDRLHKLSM